MRGLSPLVKCQYISKALTICHICANIIAMINMIIKTPNELAKTISNNARDRRKKQNLSRRRLSEISGVSFGSIRRFEETGEVSLKSLLKIAVVLDCTNDFEGLFTQKEPKSIQEIIDGKF